MLEESPLEQCKEINNKKNYLNKNYKSFNVSKSNLRDEDKSTPFDLICIFLSAKKTIYAKGFKYLRKNKM